MTKKVFRVFKEGKNSSHKNKQGIMKFKNAETKKNQLDVKYIIFKIKYSHEINFRPETTKFSEL